MQFLITATVVILLVGVVSSCPSVCRCWDLSNGLIVECLSRRLDSIPTDLPDNTEILRLDHNAISVIEDNIFNNLPSLQVLKLYDNKITSIKSDMFNTLTNLKDLNLGHNDISVIENKAFNNLPNLQSLNLGQNDISVIEDNTFNNLPNLQVLYLYSNTITSIKSDTFNNLPNLNRLWLNNNAISVIEDNTFNNLTNLQELYLYSNKITSIKSYMFNNLPNLKLLDLVYNDISVIEDNAFNNLFNLSRLHLQNNNISEIDGNAFNDLPNLHYLEFDMYCGNCINIPFWRWLQINQKFSNSITCYDLDGEKLSNLQPNKVADCFIVPKSADNYIAVYICVGIFVVTALVAVIVFATLRYRRKRATEYENATFGSGRLNIGTQNTEHHYDVVQYRPYDIIET